MLAWYLRSDRNANMISLESLCAIGNQLRESLQGMVDSLPTPPQRPQELARALNLNSNLTSRVFAALRSQDPLAAMSMLPGPVPLRQMAKAAEAHGASQTHVQQARLAIDNFETIIREEFDDRAGLRSMLGAMVPESRRRSELTAKQSAFRAMETITGITSESEVMTYIAHPSSHSDELGDAVFLKGSYGYRRIRPGAPLRHLSFANKSIDIGMAAHVPTGLPGDDPEEYCLRPFCRPTSVTFNKVEAYGRVDLELEGDAIGRTSAVDLVTADYRPQQVRMDPHVREGKVRYITLVLGTPCKLVTIDWVLHESIWPGCSFDIQIYDTTAEGFVDLNSPSRHNNRFDLSERVDFLGKGVNMLRSSKIPRYVESVSYVAERMGWDASKFRTFRCQIAYPVYGSQICLVYRPAANAGTKQ